MFEQYIRVFSPSIVIYFTEIHQFACIKKWLFISANMDRYSVIAMADAFINMLHYHSEMGAAMRKVMTQALINPQLYYQLAVCEY